MATYTVEEPKVTYTVDEPKTVYTVENPPKTPNHFNVSGVGDIPESRRGNINLNNRPRVKNFDGSISTVRSKSFNFDGQEVLLPTISEDGRIMSDQETVNQYRRTGRHLGKFNSIEEATVYAQKLHEDQSALVSISEMRQARPKTIPEKIKGFFRESPTTSIAKAQNIYAISQNTGIPLAEVRNNYQRLVREEKMTGIKPGVPTGKEFTSGLLTPVVAAGLAVNPLPTLAGLGTFALLDKLIPTEKFIPSDINDDLRTTIELADFIAKGAIVGGVFKKTPAMIEKFTKNKLTEFNLPKTIKLTAEQVKDIRQTGELTTPEEVSLFGSLGLTSSQQKGALKQGVSINVPAEKIVRLVDKPYWQKIKSVFGIKPFEQTTSILAQKPTIAPSGLLPEKLPIRLPPPMAKVAPTTKAPVVEPPIVSPAPAIATPVPVVAPVSTVQPSIAPKDIPIVKEARKHRSAEGELNKKFPSDIVGLDDQGKFVIKQQNKYTTLENATLDDVWLLQQALEETQRKVKNAQLLLFNQGKRGVKKLSDEEFKKLDELVKDEEATSENILQKFHLKLQDLIDNPTILSDAIKTKSQQIAPKVPIVQPDIITKAEQAPIKPISETVKPPEVIKKKKTLEVLPQKDQLLIQIQDAIKKAPGMDEVYTFHKQKLGLEGNTAEEQKQIYNAMPKVAFQIDGGANIINTKESLTKFYDSIKKTPATMSTQAEIPSPKTFSPEAHKEKIDALYPIEAEGYFTDRKLLIKGQPPLKVKVKESPTVTTDNINTILNAKTLPAKKLYYFVNIPNDISGTSQSPIPVKDEDYPPVVVFESNDKYYKYEQARFNAIPKRYPNATYGIDDNGHLIAYDNNVPVAALLPRGTENKVFTTIPPHQTIEQNPPSTPIKEPTFHPSKKQGEMFKPSVSGSASVKAFAMPEGGLEEWIKRTQEQNIQLKPLEMPELVKLAQDLMGKYPVVKKLVTNLGLFKFGKGIALDVKIFKNPQIAGIVLAHEIGHLIDWLPDNTLARGNILGRIATLRRYLKSTLAEKPGMEGTVLTPKDRERLRRVAELELKAELKLGEREIIEEIFKEVPIYEQTKLTPDEVLSVWREQGTTIKVTNPQLYDFIAGLSSAQKKSIIQQALKGVIDERLLRLQGGKKIGVKIIKEQVTRRIIPEEVTPQAIRKRFRQLLKEEIVKRKLFSLEVIKEELKKVTQWWNPFDDTVKGWYVNYRYGADELYAEAISVLLNKPEKLEDLAPQFYKAFWNYIDRKPEVKKALLELQDFLNMGEGEKLRVRQEDVYSMFKKGEELFYDKRKEYELREKSLWFKLRTELIDKNTGVLDKLKLAEKQGKIINPEDNPKYYLEEYNYIGGKLKNDLEGIQKDVRDNLEKNGLDDEQFGSYLFFRRVVTERSDIANPLGHNRETAQRQLEYLHSILGDEKFRVLESSGIALRNKMEALLSEADKVGLYKPETIEELITNKEYAPFQVLDYLDDYVSPSVIQQIGTLKPIANPFTSTILKMLSLRRVIERVKTNNSVINFMTSAFPKEIEKAKTRHISKYKSEIPEKEGFAIIKTRENGKLVGYYVDPYIAQSVNATPRNINNAVISVLRFLNSGYFRPVYVNLNLGFQTFNFLRDFIRAWKLNPETSFPAMLGYYWKALPIAKQRIWGNFNNPVIAEMQQSGMLSFTYNNIMRGVEKDDETQIEFLLRQYDILKKNPSNPIKEIFNFIEELGDFVETIPKVAGYLSRIKDPNKRNIKEIAREVRIFAGSPDFLRKGAGYDWSNNVFLFSNAIKEGIRADIEGAFKNPKTRSGYWWRTARVTFLPKILAFLAALGFFGQKIKENFDKQTEYDKTNYTTIPLGMAESGKAIYMRLPQDEMGRLLGGIFWKSLSLAKDRDIKSMQDILSLTGGQIPSISPAIELTSSWSQYLTGKNPYDWFRGREILTDDERMAGGWYSLKPMMGWTAGKLGIYGATIKAQNDETTIEKTVKWTPILQRFIRITDYGETEAERKNRQERTRMKAIRSIQKKELR